MSRSKVQNCACLTDGELKLPVVSIVSTPPAFTGGVGKSEKVLNWGGPGFSKIAGGDT